MTLKLWVLMNSLLVCTATEMWERLRKYKEHHCTEGVVRGYSSRLCCFVKCLLDLRMPVALRPWLKGMVSYKPTIHSEGSSHWREHSARRRRLGIRSRGKKVWIGYKESPKHGTKLAFTPQSPPRMLGRQVDAHSKCQKWECCSFASMSENQIQCSKCGMKSTCSDLNRHVMRATLRRQAFACWYNLTAAIWGKPGG